MCNIKDVNSVLCEIKLQAKACYLLVTTRPLLIQVRQPAPFELQ